MKVPFLDLKSHHQPHRAEFSRAIEAVIDQGAFAGGPYVEEFEAAFAKFCNARFAIGVGSGTDALWLALLAHGIGPGDEVITVPSSFIATAEAITYVGATPVFVDIDERTYNMDPTRLADAVTSRTKAIIPVHLFGQPADMDPILNFAKDCGLAVIEDAAQAHGAEYRGRRAGSMGAVGCFSFYPGKNLGAFGEGGAVTTSDEELYEKMRCLRDHGQTKKYHHSMVGWNCRLDGIQGAVLNIKLKYLEDSTDRRVAHADRYDSELGGLDGIITPYRSSDTRHVYHIYSVRVPDREGFMGALNEKGIGCGIHYPVPIHLQECYADLGLGEGSFPVAERCAREFVSLPMFPELSEEQTDYVVAGVKEAAAGAMVA